MSIHQPSLFPDSNTYSTHTNFHDFPLPIAGSQVQISPSFYSEGEANDIMQSLMLDTPWQQDCIQMQGKTIPVPRLQAWVGDKNTHYGYSGIKLCPTPWTALLDKIKNRIEVVTKHTFNAVLINLYRDGRDSVSWHADNEKELGDDPIIASLSLGADRRFQLRTIDKAQRTHSKTVNLTLTHGSLLLMGSGTQKLWLHQIPKQIQVSEPRINLTFRFIKPR